MVCFVHVAVELRTTRDDVGEILVTKKALVGEWFAKSTLYNGVGDNSVTDDGVY